MAALDRRFAGTQQDLEQINNRLAAGPVGRNVQASTDVSFRLSYYFCPDAVLPSVMRNFSLVRTDRQVSLRWITDDEKISNRYTIQYSRDGVNFENLETRQAMTLGTASYDYRLRGVHVPRDRAFDFFAPVVDDVYAFGRIAAANALSWEP